MFENSASSIARTIVDNDDLFAGNRRIRYRVYHLPDGANLIVAGDPDRQHAGAGVD